jgi:hypothetical protein
LAVGGFFALFFIALAKKKETTCSLRNVQSEKKKREREGCSWGFLLASMKAFKAKQLTLAWQTKQKQSNKKS